MKEHLFMKINRLDGLQCRQIYFKLLERYGDDTLLLRSVLLQLAVPHAPEVCGRRKKDWPTP
jgi:hypothetical protein